MALEPNDLMVVQKASGAQEIRKATMQQLSDFLQTSDTVAYKGTANFTQAGEEPTTKNTGDLYINSALADGTWAWSANSGGITDVSPGDRAIWNGTNWDIIQSGAGDAGVTEVQGTLPISVADGDTDTPVVSVREATTTLDGVVARLATDGDVNATTGTGSTTAVVTADLLKDTNSAIEALITGVSTVTASEPLSVTGDADEPNVESREATTALSGHVQRLATAADVDADTGTGAAGAVVTADLLKATNSTIDGLITGVSTVTASEPLSITGDADEPNVQSREATTAISGHVQRLATVADVAKDGSGDANAVVTADLLKATNIGLDAATAGGLTQPLLVLTRLKSLPITVKAQAVVLPLQLLLLKTAQLVKKVLSLFLTTVLILVPRLAQLITQLG